MKITSQKYGSIERYVLMISAGLCVILFLVMLFSIDECCPKLKILVFFVGSAAIPAIIFGLILLGLKIYGVKIDEKEKEEEEKKREIMEKKKVGK